MELVEDFNQQRSLLFGLAYRMLGSVMDAEDVLQEAFLKWQASARETVQSPKAYLIRIVTHLCIDHLRLARVRREEYVGTWLPEPLIQPTGEAPDDVSELNETLSTAFLLLLERLSPVDRAVLLLHDVFGYTYGEIAPIIQRNPADVRQIGHRARARIAEGRPRFDASAEEAEQVTRQFIHAVKEGDLPQLLAVLSEDATLFPDTGGKVKAARNPIYGADHVARFLVGAERKWAAFSSMRLMWINGQPAVAKHRDDRIIDVMTFAISEGRIHAIYRVLNPDKLRRIASM
jgi:RNA polymerase sigma-70 factor (ECF subfamily)